MLTCNKRLPCFHNFQCRNTQVVTCSNSNWDLNIRLYQSPQRLILNNPTSARAPHCVLHWCPVRTGFLKITWLPLGHSWNRVSGLIAAVVCPKGAEPWEKSEEAWPGSNNTPLYWDPRSKSAGDHQKFFWNDQHSYACKWAPRESHKQSQHFPLRGYPLLFVICSLKAIPNK